MALFLVNIVGIPERRNYLVVVQYEFHFFFKKDVFLHNISLSFNSRQVEDLRFDVIVDFVAYSFILRRDKPQHPQPTMPHTKCLTLYHEGKWTNTKKEVMRLPSLTSGSPLPSRNMHQRCPAPSSPSLILTVIFPKRAILHILS